MSQVKYLKNRESEPVIAAMDIIDAQIIDMEMRLRQIKTQTAIGILKKRFRNSVWFQTSYTDRWYHAYIEGVLLVMDNKDGDNMFIDDVLLDSLFNAMSYGDVYNSPSTKDQAAVGCYEEDMQ